ncbi:uncharacterized protein [Branchiostoma lanceolatum]|uniref:uncharacterized protein n=1 Tax=Branchiostoma lanceolatum TaxID=7740 RepID=UPI003451A287
MVEMPRPRLLVITVTIQQSGNWTDGHFKIVVHPSPATHSGVECNVDITVTERPGTGPPKNTSFTTMQPSRAGLSKGEIAGIALSVVLVALIAVLATVIIKTRKDSERSAENQLWTLELGTKDNEDQLATPPNTAEPTESETNAPEPPQITRI